MKTTVLISMRPMLLVTIFLMVIGCGGDSTENNTSNLNEKSTVSGTLLDDDGQPIVGALVVAGENSPTDITDENGEFEITDVPAGDQSLNVITEGHYTLEDSKIKINGDVNVGTIRSKIIDEHFRSPKFKNVSVIVNNGKVIFEAEINQGEEGSAIKDVRAELSGYNTGIALTLSETNIYVGEIDLPENAGGPKLSAVFFGIDQDRRVGTSYAMSNNFTGNGGEYDLSSIDGTWTGALKFHKRDRDERGEQHGHSKLEIVNGSVDAVYTSPSFRLLKSDSSIDPFVDIVYENGSVEMVDQFLGTYLIHLEKGDDIINLLAYKRDSGLIGFMKISSASSDSNKRTSRGRFHLKLNNDRQRTVADLNGKWISSMSLLTSTATNSNNSWSPYYQLNALTEIGLSSSGITTLGHVLTDISVNLLDASLGKYKIVYSYDDGSENTVWALLGYSSNRLFGVHEVRFNNEKTCGLYWSRRGNDNDLFSTEDFSGWYLGELIFNATDIAEKRIKRIVFHLDDAGSIDKGVLNLIDSGINSGSFNFTDTASGKISGSIVGTVINSDIPNFSIQFSTDNIRSATMGVMKGRLVGEFTGNLNDVDISGTMRVHKIHRATRTILDRIRDHARD